MTRRTVFTLTPNPPKPPEFSQLAIVPGGASGKIGIQKRHESIPTQFAFDPRSMRLIPGALKNFEQDEIADQKRFATGSGLEFGSCRRSMATEMRDPDGAVDENHDRRDGRP